MDRKSFLGGLLVLLLVPLLVLAAFAVYVFVANAPPQPGPVETSVRPQVVWPWQEAVDLITVHGDQRPDGAPTPKPVDIVFLIDVSRSMKESLGAMANAAYRVAQEIAAGQPGRVRFALIRFDTEAEVTTTWTADPEILRRGLDRLEPFTGGNDSRKAFMHLEEILRQVRPGANPAAVFYTDGYLDSCKDCLPPAMSEEEIAAAARELRGRGVQLYSVGIPGGDSNPLMVEVTGSADRVFDPGSIGDLGRVFRSVANGALGVPVHGGLLTQRLDGRHFSAPLEGTAWSQGAGGALQLELGDIPDAATTYWHPLVPHSAGLWNVGLEPPRLTYLDKKTGDPVEVSASRRPVILVITWLTLLLALLPALLWALVHRPRRPRSVFETIEPMAEPTLRQPLPPARLPSLPMPLGTRQGVLPTLFVGLGGAGRWALQAVRADLAQGHLGEPGQPYRFLWIDFDRQEAEKDEPPLAPWEGYPIEHVLAPLEVARLGAWLPEPGEVPEPWSWFDAVRYRDTPRDDLNLAKGARGDRALARLALFRWLERGGVVPELARACRDAAGFPSADGTWQAVVLASRDGGVGSGCFLDVGRLLQRLGRDLQAQGRKFAPEVLGVLCESPEKARPENREALALEIQSATRAGGYPLRTAYVPGDPLLDRTETETPFHRIFSVSGSERASVAGQCGELASLLVERIPRLETLDAARAAAAGAGRVAAVQARGVHVLPTLVQDQVRIDLLLRLLGPDVLLDIQAAPEGGFEPAQVTEERAIGLLTAWAGEEPEGAPLQILLAAAAQGDATRLKESFEKGSAPDGSWWEAAFAISAGIRMHGRRGDPGTPWRRGWMPGEGAAVLSLLEGRLSGFASELSQPALIAAVDVVRQRATAAADSLSVWLADLCGLCEKLADRKVRSAECLGLLRKLQGRTLLEPPAGLDEIESWARECLEVWLGTSDVVSPLREHLFFAFTGTGSGGVVLRSYVAEPAEFGDARAALKALEAMCRALARLVPASRIGGALLPLKGDRRAVLARGLIDRGARPVQVVVAVPAEDGLPPSEARVVQAFCGEIPQPADHGARREVESEDASAVRRLELQEGFVPEAGFVAVVEAAEQAAERTRERVQRTYGIAVPPFPVELRIALAHPDAFRSFSRAYAAGRIVHRPDVAGRAQWFFLDRMEPLTFGTDSGLAAAAAGYVWYVDQPAESFEVNGAGGDFAPLRQWAESAGNPDEHVLCLAAIDVCRDPSGG